MDGNSNVVIHGVLPRKQLVGWPVNLDDRLIADTSGHRWLGTDPGEGWVESAIRSSDYSRRPTGGLSLGSIGPLSNISLVQCLFGSETGRSKPPRSATDRPSVRSHNLVLDRRSLPRHRLPGSRKYMGIPKQYVPE